MSTEPDVGKLRDLFASFQCHGVVALIEYLVSPQAKGLRCIGSSTIGLTEIMKEIFLTEEARMASAWFRTKSLHIGSNDGSVTPLQWLEKFAEVFEHVSVPEQKRFDELCGEFAQIPQLKLVGEVEIWNRGRIFRIPVEVYDRNMSDAELELYRVPKSKLFGDEDDS